MFPQLLTLLFTGLCVGHGDTAGDGPLPRPSLTAWPSSVVPDGGEVTLTCRGPTRDPVKFVLRRGGNTVQDVPSPESTEGLAEFRLTGLTGSVAGEYTCEYLRKVSPKTTSPPSEALLLLVTGHLSKPSLQAHPRGEVTAGENVTLRCQWPRHVTESTHFALLKAGAPTPTQVSAARDGGAEFPLVSVTAQDSGNYSCVHYMTRPPFSASRPSDAISIQVTDTSGTGSPETARGLGPTGLALTAASAVLLVLLASILIYKYARRGAAPDKVTTSSCSLKQPGEVETGAAVPTQSCSPALAEGAQVSRAEEPHGVTYAELNTRALRKLPASQKDQSLETCIYSALKT